MNNDWLDIELLEDYLDGKLDSKAMHKLEKQALEDPFVAQALEGLLQSPKRAAQSVSILQKQLYERIAQQQIKKKETVFTWQRLSVAAAAAVLFITVSIIFFMKEKVNREQFAKNRPKTVEVNIAPLPVDIDSAKNDVYARNIPEKAVAKEIKDPGILKKEIQTATTADIDTLHPQSFGRAAAVADTAVTTNVMTRKAANAELTTVKPAISAPIGGWSNLDSYLSDHNQFTKENKTGELVELSFRIDNEGRPADIKIEKSVSQAFDDEAVRLIKEGPKWEQPKLPGRVSYTIAF